MKHVVLFSGGAASSYVAYLVLQEQSKKDVILLHTPTFSEDKDADRFRCQVANYLKMPITIWGDGRSTWDLIIENQWFPSAQAGFCTRLLKYEQKEKFYKYLKEIGEEFIEYVGFGAEEWMRVQNATIKAEVKNRIVKFPLFVQKISNEEVKRIIQDDWKIELPQPYKYLKHNNCIPCFKAGQADFKLYWQFYPEAFAKAIEYEKLIGHTVFKDSKSRPVLLETLAGYWQNNKEFDDMQCNMWDDTPCQCWSV